jgi:hypothetical protein
VKKLPMAFLFGTFIGFGTLAVVSLPVIPYHEVTDANHLLLQDPPPVNASHPSGPMQLLQRVLPGLPGTPSQPPVLRVVRTTQAIPQTQDPIWSVQLVVNGAVAQEMPALIGRANRQNLDRHTAGNKSPLPVGTYRIDHAGIEWGPFPDPEVGRGYWVPITPLFQTGRSLLGIHQDPSWGKLNGESGTSGCIGLDSPEKTKELVKWIQDYKIKTLVVES